jgi:hypothetical protein
MMSANWFSAPAPTTRRVRGYFAPVDRPTKSPTIFDAAEQGSFDLDDPPAPWIGLGCIQNLARKALSKTVPVLTGVPAATLEQVRETVSAEVSFEFLSWTKLTMALATGSQHMNVLAARPGAMPAGMGGDAEAAITVQSGSTATHIALASADSSSFTAGSIVAIDADYVGQVGFVGSPVAGAYLRKPLSDVDYIRRVTFNVGLVTEVCSDGLTLATPIPNGAPAAGSKLQAVTGFVDREGGSFYQEWSALFVLEGSQRERIFFYYPRLQTLAGAEEAMSPHAGDEKSGINRVLLKGNFMALPVADPLDGERVLCYRSFLPAPKALV